MKKISTLILAMGSCLIFAQSPSKTDTDSKKGTDSKSNTDSRSGTDSRSVTEKDRKWCEETAKAGMMEVKLGELSQTKATNSSVKMHGEHMVTDHTKANKELKELAATKGIKLPTSMGEKNQKMYDKLAALEGKEFDKKYADAMVAEHKKDIASFKKQGEKGDDTEIKDWAAGKVSVLEDHLKMWKETCDEMKDKKAISAK